MEKRINIKQVVKYNGHTISGNGSVNLTFKAAYSELTKTIELQQLLNNDIEIKCRIPSEPTTVRLGLFKIKQCVIDGDGESKIKFVSLKEYVETDKLNSLPLNSDNLADFAVQYAATVEIEEDGEEN